MFDMTRGPSMKPVCAATNSSAASATSVSTTNHFPKPTRSTSTAFIVLPGSDVAPTSR